MIYLLILMLVGINVYAVEEDPTFNEVEAFLDRKKVPEGMVKDEDYPVYVEASKDEDGNRTFNTYISNMTEESDDGVFFYCNVEEKKDEDGKDNQSVKMGVEVSW